MPAPRAGGGVGGVGTVWQGRRGPSGQQAKELAVASQSRSGPVKGREGESQVALGGDGSAGGMSRGVACGDWTAAGRLDGLSDPGMGRPARRRSSSANSARLLHNQCNR